MKYYLVIFAVILCCSGCMKHEPAANSSRIDSMKNAAKGWVEAINSHKLDDLDKYIAEDVTEHTSLDSREGKLVKGWLSGIKRLIGDRSKNKPESDDHITIEDIRAEGDICVIREFTTGTKKVDSSGVMVHRRNNRVETNWMRWENGKFVEGWWDLKD